jgi:hypothetical protein
MRGSCADVMPLNPPEMDTRRRSIEIRPVQDVEEFSAELDAVPLSNGKVLEHDQVPINKLERRLPFAMFPKVPGAAASGSFGGRCVEPKSIT